MVSLKEGLYCTKFDENLSNIAARIVPTGTRRQATCIVYYFSYTTKLLDLFRESNPGLLICQIAC